MRNIITACSLLLTFGSNILTAEPAPDYRQGFETFQTLGLPDTAGAAYVTIHPQNLPQGYRQHDHYSGRAGNGWLISESNDVVTVIIGNALEIQAVRATGRAMMRHAAQETEADDDAAALPQIMIHIQPADLAGDIERMVTALDGIAGEQHRRRHAMTEHGGAWLLFAAQIYTHGYTNEANRIAHSVFEMAGESRRAILLGLNRMLDEKYLSAYAGFINTRDWTAFSTEIVALVNQHPQGWRTREMIADIAVGIEPRVSGTPPPEPRMEHLSDVDREQALALTRPPDAPTGAYMGHSAPAFWLLPAQDTVTGMQRHGVHATQFTAITTRGRDAIPLLIALVNDTYPTYFDSTLLMRSGIIRHVNLFSMSSSQSHQTSPWSIPRPLPRGIIARYLLIPVMINDLDKQALFDLPDAVFIEHAAEWYTRIKGHTDDELLKLYFNEGADDIRGQLAGILMNRDDDKNHDLLVNYISGLDHPDNFHHLVEGYAARRGATAAPLVNAYLQRLKEQHNVRITQSHHSEEYVARMNSSLSNRVEKLSALLDAQDLNGLLNEMVESGKLVDDIRQTLQTRLRHSTGNTAETITAIINSTAALDDPGERMKLMQTVWFIPALMNRYAHMMHHPRAFRQMTQPDAADNTSVVPDLDALRPALEKLLHDRRIPVFAETIAPATVAHYTAMLIEKLYDAQNAMRVDLLLYSTGITGWDFLLQRTNARLAGETTADFPDQELLSTMDKTPLIEQAGNTADSAAWLSALPLDQQMALQLADKETLPPGFTEAAWKGVEWHIAKDTSIPDDLRNALAAPLTSQSIRVMLEIMRRSAAEGQPLSVKIVRQPLLRGAVALAAPPAAAPTVDIHRRRFGSSGRMTAMQADGDARVIGGIKPDNSSVISTQWGTQTQPPVNDSPSGHDLLDALYKEAIGAIEKSMETEDAAFWQAVETLLDGSDHPLRIAHIEMTAVPATVSQTGEEQE